MSADRPTSIMARRRVKRGAPIRVAASDNEALKRELDRWVNGREGWNEGEWNALMCDLRLQGFTDLIDTPKGREIIEGYLKSRCGK